MISIGGMNTDRLKLGYGIFIPEELLQPKSTFGLRDDFRAIFEE
jgi:hypothetical protein